MSVQQSDTAHPSSGISRYMEAVRNLLDVIAVREPAALQRAADAIVQALRNDGMLYLFGTGHSHMLAEEGHFRAGGLAPVVPILSSALMLHEGAAASSHVERTSGVAKAILSRYVTRPGDVIVIFSNSGANTVPVEMALTARERGMTVIGVIALDYAATVKVGPAGHKLADIADIVIDNHGVPGDALVEVGGGLRTGPSSTLAGAFILNAILSEVASQLAQDAGGAPVYISANMPNAAEHNAGLIQRYRPRNPHL